MIIPLGVSFAMRRKNREPWRIGFQGQFLLAVENKIIATGSSSNPQHGRTLNSFPGSFLYFLEVEKGPCEGGWAEKHKEGPGFVEPATKTCQKNHTLDLFGAKASQENILSVLERFFGLKVAFNDGLPS